MSTDTQTTETQGTHVEETVHKHPSDSDYAKIAIILAVITAAEVATYFWEGASTVGLVLVLFPMMIAKFVIVVAYFMHLKYDNPLFKRIFVFGLLLAGLVFIGVLAAFEFWDDRYLRFLTG